MCVFVRHFVSCSLSLSLCASEECIGLIALSRSSLPFPLICSSSEAEEEAKKQHREEGNVAIGHVFELNCAIVRC